MGGILKDSFFASVSRRSRVIVIALSVGAIAMLVLAGGPVMAQGGAPTAKISVPKGVFDFGSVAQGTLVTHDFPIRNEGTADLTIQKVIAGCGCTASAPSASSIPPGGAANVSVTFDSSGFEGNHSKDVRVFTNDPDTPSTILTLRGYVETLVTVDPPRVAFGEVYRGAVGGAVKEVSVTLKEGSPYSVESARTFGSAVQVSPVAGGSSKSKTFKVSLAPETQSGELRDRVVVMLRGSDGKERSVSVPVIASVKGTLRLQPSVVSFGVLEGSDIERSIRLTNSGREPIDIVSVSSDSPAILASSKAVQQGKSFVIRVKVDPTKVTSDLKGRVTIETTSKSEPTLSLNVLGVLPSKG